MPPKLFTIGYEGAALSDFIAALQAAGVTRLIDVRETPYSRRKEFCAEELKTALEAHDIAYTHLRELGNPPEGRQAARAGHGKAYREVFAAHMETKGAQAGLRRAAAFAQSEPACLMCLERAPSRCHRAPVAERLIAITGQEICHLTVSAGRGDPAQASFDL